MANQTPVLVPAGALAISQVRIDRSSLSSTETIQSSESELSTISKAALVRTTSLSNRASSDSSTNATDGIICSLGSLLDI